MHYYYAQLYFTQLCLPNTISLLHEFSSIDANYVDNGNWETESYNRGVRAGADQVVAKYEKRCLENTADECTDLGIAAAQGEPINMNLQHSVI